MRAIFDLTKTNMLDHYTRAAESEPSEWTWSDKKKMKELRHPEARFLVVRSGTSEAAAEGKAAEDSQGASSIVGMAHFRFVFCDSPPDIHLLCLHAAAFKLCWVLGSSVDSATAPPRPPLESHSRAK